MLGKPSMLSLFLISFNKSTHVRSSMNNYPACHELMVFFSSCQGYYCEMDNRTMQHLIPDELVGKQDILFGNLDQIYRFHHE